MLHEEEIDEFGLKRVNQLLEEQLERFGLDKESAKDKLFHIVAGDIEEYYYDEILLLGVEKESEGFIFKIPEVIEEF